MEQTPPTTCLELSRRSRKQRGYILSEGVEAAGDLEFKHQLDAFGVLDRGVPSGAYRAALEDNDDELYEVVCDYEESGGDEGVSEVFARASKDAIVHQQNRELAEGYAGAVEALDGHGHLCSSRTTSAGTVNNDWLEVFYLPWRFRWGLSQRAYVEHF